MEGERTFDHETPDGMPYEFEGYKFRKLLGRGACGAVYLYEKENGDKLALKAPP